MVSASHISKRFPMHGLQCHELFMPALCRCARIESIFFMRFSSFCSVTDWPHAAGNECIFPLWHLCVAIRVSAGSVSYWFICASNVQLFHENYPRHRAWCLAHGSQKAGSRARWTSMLPCCLPFVFCIVCFGFVWFLSFAFRLARCLKKTEKCLSIVKHNL